MANLSKDETYSAICEGTYKAIYEAVWSDRNPCFWTTSMSDAISKGAYRAVYEAEEKRIFGGLINNGD